MAKINKIKLSGTTYDVEDLNATKTVELTQAQYDALVSGGTVDPNTYYIISDASGGDLSQYWTSAQTQSAITQATSGKVDTTTFETYSGNVETALSGKQDTLIAGDNITISGNVISATGGGGGGGVTSAQVQTMIDTSVPQDRLNKIYGYSTSGTSDILFWSTGSTSQIIDGYVPFAKVNNNSIIGSTNDYSLIPESAITTSVTSASTDSQVPSAKAVYDQLGGMKIVKLTESEYTALVSKDSNTLYVVIPDPSN